MGVIDELPPMREKQKIEINAENGGRISREGMALVMKKALPVTIQSLLNSRDLSFIGLGNAVGWNWNKGHRIAVVKANKSLKTIVLSGVFPKRLSKYVKEALEVDLPKDVLEAVGAIAKAHIPPGKTYIYDLTDKFDWKDGDFGDKGSCFWASKASAKNVIAEHNGMALRFYYEHVTETRTTGYARCWVIPRAGALLTMNGYGLDLLEQSQVLAEIVGATAVRVGLTNNERHDGIVWINNARGYIISDAPPERDTQLDLHFDTRRRCVKCERMYDGQSYWVDDLEVCGLCLENAHRCGNCMKWSFSMPERRYQEMLGCALCINCAKTVVVCDKGRHAWYVANGWGPSQCPYCDRGKPCVMCTGVTVKTKYYGVLCEHCHMLGNEVSLSDKEEEFYIKTPDKRNFLITEGLRGYWKATTIRKPVRPGPKKMRLAPLPVGPQVVATQVIDMNNVYINNIDVGRWMIVNDAWTWRANAGEEDNRNGP